MPNKYLKAILVAILIGSDVFAGPPPPPPPLPINGGVIGLFLVAIGYAVKKIRDNYKS